MSRKRDVMRPYHLRMPADTLKRVHWLAEEKGLEPYELIRIILSDATRNARPPERVQEHVVGCTDKQWGAWRDAAQQVGLSLDQLICRTMDAVVRKVFAPKD